MKIEQTECSETSAHKIRTPGNHPIERIQYTNIDPSNNLEYLRLPDIHNSV